MDELLLDLVSSFDLKLMVSITVLTWIVLKLIEYFKIKTTKAVKKLITVILSLVLCFVYYKFLNLTLQELIPTYLISVAFYDNLIKFILNKFHLGYNK